MSSSSPPQLPCKPPPGSPLVVSRSWLPLLPRRSASTLGLQSDMGYRYQLTLNPSSQLQLQLAYRPTTVAQHGFELPLTLQTAGVVGIRASACCKPVSARGTPPGLLLLHSLARM
jgi:hypothetical protein